MSSIEKEEKKSSKEKMKIFFSKKGTFETSIIILIIAMLFAIFLLFRGTIAEGASALKDNYLESYANQKDITYNEKYDAYKNDAEEKFHVSNSVSIYVGNLKEEEKLEVLKVQDVEFIITDSDDNQGNVEAWLEVPGEATFVVDLKAGEYIVDNERCHVLVRVPYPELTNVKIDYKNVEKLLFKDDVLNGSYSVGEELAMEMLSEAELLIRQEFTSNQNFFRNAEEAATNSIEMLVRQLNPKVEELQIDVEFY